MAESRFWLEDSSQSKAYSFGTTASGGEGLVTINKGIAAASTVVLDAKGSVSIGGDLNLIGNLNITGNINEQSVTNLAVTDINITLNKGGTTAGASSAGIFLEGDSAAIIGKILYDSTLTSKWKIGDGTTQVEVVTVSGAQTLTNKTIGGGQISGNISGNAANVTGTVAVANGGTGATTLTGYVKGTGTTAMTASATIPAADISGNISGNAANVTGTVAVGNGGTGTTTLSGLIKGNGTSAFTAAVAGTDYSGGTAALGTGILKSTTTTGALTIAVAGDFPTLNQNTTGSAATLTTSRSIHGGTFNGSADVTNIIASTYGGTGNGFTKFTGATATEKTYTLPDANATILTTNAAVTVAQGGTGKTSFTIGTLLVGNGTSAPTELTGVTTGNVVTWSGTAWVSQAPSGTTSYQHEVTVAGTQDSSNKIFTISNAVSTGSLIVFRNGQALKAGASNDYTLSGTTITFTASFVAPRSTDTLMAYGTY